MDEQIQRETFAKNFRWYVDNSGKSQRDIAKDLGYSYTTVNTWYRGAALPNAVKIHNIADYFRIGKSQLLDPHEMGESTSEGYYANPETAKIAQEIFDNPSLRALFDAAKDTDPEDMKKMVKMIKLWKGET